MFIIFNRTRGSEIVLYVLAIYNITMHKQKIAQIFYLVILFYFRRYI